MIRHYQEPILNQPIANLEFSEEFKGITEILGMHTIADILKRHTRELQQLPGFSIQLIHEYIHYLEKRGLGHLIDPIK